MKEEDDEPIVIDPDQPQVQAHVIRCLGCRRSYLDLLSACPYCKLPKA